MRRLVLAALLLLAIPTTASAQSASPGNILIGCSFDHAANDDPIVFPGQPGVSHTHAFFGAVGIDAFSSFMSARASASTCKLPGDTGGYWMPAIIKGGATVTPTTMSVYYRRAGAPSVTQLPMDLRHVQGNSSNTSTSTYAMTYGCGSGAQGTTIPTACPLGVGVNASIYFSRCWNGVNTDNATHKTLGPCGSAFPLAVAQLQETFIFPVGAVGGRLSSDHAGAPAGTSGHADFANWWDPATMKKVTDLCLNSDRHCRVDVQGQRVYDSGAPAPFPTVFTF